MDKYDVIIIGLGPAGVAAAVYAGRKKLKTLIIGKDIGGQSVVSKEIHNWIGIPVLPGTEMAMRLYDHLDTVKNEVEVLEGEIVSQVEKRLEGQMPYFSVKAGEKEYFGKTILVASGSSRRKLGIEGEKKYSANGVFYCSICDAPLLKGKSVAVIGGGNAGLEAVIDLIPYANKIYLLEVADKLRGDDITQEKALSDEKVECILNARALKINGDKIVTSLDYEDIATGKVINLEIQGVFVEIGSIPNSSFLSQMVEINKLGEIIVDPTNGKTSQEGIWAAGDITSLSYNQNNIAMGDAIRAILNIYDYLVIAG